MHKSHMLARYTIGFVLGLFAMLSAATSSAEETYGEKTVRLSSFHPESGPIRMHGISEGVDIYLPLSSTAQISDTWIDLQFIHSIVLLGKRSSIRVLFNETTLAQIPYNPEQPMAKAKVRIPDELWRAGFNKLSLSVIQHYIDRCEDSTSPELWTELDLHNSILSYNIEPLDRELKLRDLSGLFSPGIGGMKSIQLLSSPDADLSTPRSSYLNESLPLVAQSLALHRDYSPLSVEHARWKANRQEDTKPVNRQDVRVYMPDSLTPEAHVLVGVRDELASILPDELLAKINGPFIHLDRVDIPASSKRREQSDKGIRLIVSGISAEEVNQAARSLARMDDSQNALQHLEPLNGELGERAAALSDSYFLLPDASYTVAELGTPTSTMRGAGSKKVTVELPIRGNFYTQETTTFDLMLDFAYGAGMGTGSVMSVFLNGEYVHGLPLNQPNGGTFRGYRISLPARKLQPGTNTLEFDFSLRAETVAGECRSIPASHLIVQILDTSMIHLPPASPVAIQPDLSTFSATAFPYIDSTDDGRTEIAVASESLLGDALSLAGKLAQVSRTTAGEMFVRTTIPDKLMNNTILLATRDEMPKKIFKRVSDKLEQSENWVSRLLNKLRSAHAAAPRQSKQPSFGSLTSNGGLDSLGVLMAMRTPQGVTPATLTVISANSHTLLAQRVTDLMTPQIWGQLDGDMVVWEGPEDAVLSMQVGDFYEVGDRDPWNLFILTISNNPWYMIAVLVVSFFILGLLSLRYLRKREARRLSE